MAIKKGDRVIRKHGRLSSCQSRGTELVAGPSISGNEVSQSVSQKSVAFQFLTGII